MNEQFKYQVEQAIAPMIDMCLTSFSIVTQKLPSPIDINYKIVMDALTETVSVYEANPTDFETNGSDDPDQWTPKPIHREPFEVPTHPKHTKQQCKEIIGTITRMPMSHMLNWSYSMMGKQLVVEINQNSKEFELKSIE